MLDIPQNTISVILNKIIKNGQMAEIDKDFKPYLYNIWNLNKQDNDSEYFGAFPNDVRFSA